MDLCGELRNEILPIIEGSDIVLEEFESFTAYPDY